MADRLPPIPAANWSPEQRREAMAMVAGPRGAVVAPFVPLLRSPELAGHVQRLGAYLRYNSAIGVRLNELAILVVAKLHEQGVEWAIHAPIALREGVQAEVIAAVQRGAAPGALPAIATPDESLVHEYCVALLQNRGRVSDALWASAIARFGEQAVVDLTATCGYYSLLALMMNAAQTPVPAPVPTP